MNRRDLLVSSAGFGMLAGCLGNGADESENGTDEQATDATGPPFEIELIDAPGSTARTVTLPDPGRLAMINFTRLNCPTSAAYLENIGDAHEQLSGRYDVGPDETVFVCSVINWTTHELDSNEDLADWWREQDGSWPIGIDRSGAFFDEYHGLRFPGTLVLGGDGTVHWNTERATPRKIVTEVEAAMEADSS